MTSVKAGASPACPAVRRKAGGRRRSSAARWTFVVSPSRDRPMAWSPGSPAGPLFAGPGRMLVSAHDRGVHRDSPVEILVGVGLGHQRGEHPLPGAVDGPHPQPVVDAPPVAVPLRQMHPLGAGLERESDRVDHLPMITPATTPSGRPVREQRLDPRPLRITQWHTRTNDQLIQTKPPSQPLPHSGEPQASISFLATPSRSPRRYCLAIPPLACVGQIHEDIIRERGQICVQFPGCLTVCLPTVLPAAMVRQLLRELSEDHDQALNQGI